MGITRRGMGGSFCEKGDVPFCDKVWVMGCLIGQNFPSNLCAVQGVCFTVSRGERVGAQRWSIEGCSLLELVNGNVRFLAFVLFSILSFSKSGKKHFLLPPSFQLGLQFASLHFFSREGPDLLTSTTFWHWAGAWCSNWGHLGRGAEARVQITTTTP